MKNLKHLGLSSNGKIITDFVKECWRHVFDYLETNPLKQKQIELAAKEAGKQVPDAKQAAFREVESESVFNCASLIETRDVVQNVQPARRLIHSQSTGSVRRKHILRSYRLLDFVRSLYKVVQDMLDE